MRHEDEVLLHIFWSDEEEFGWVRHLGSFVDVIGWARIPVVESLNVDYLVSEVNVNNRQVCICTNDFPLFIIFTMRKKRTIDLCVQIYTIEAHPQIQHFVIKRWSKDLFVL